VISRRRGSIRSCNESIYYINEKEKKKSNKYIYISTYVVVNVSRPMNVIIHLFVEQLLNRDVQPYVVNWQDVRYTIENFSI